MSYGENPYASPYQVGVGASDQAEFLSKTYSHLAGAVAAFVGLEVVMFQTGIAQKIAQTFFGSHMIGALVLIGGMIVVKIISEKWANSSTSLGTQYAGLGLYVVGEAIFFAPLLYIATQMEMAQGVDILGPAAVLTLVLFTALTAVVFITRKDFSFLRSFLYFASIGAFLVILFSIFFGMSAAFHFWFVVAMIGLACGWILWDTSNVLHHYQNGQHVAASLQLFSSLALLFWYAIRLMMILQSDD